MYIRSVIRAARRCRQRQTRGQRVWSAQPQPGDVPPFCGRAGRVPRRSRPQEHPGAHYNPERRCQ